MYYVFATRERELFSSSPPLWSFRVTQSLFYFIPGCYFTTEDAVHLIFGKIFGRIVLVYDDRNTVFCDYCCGKTAIDLHSFPFLYNSNTFFGKTVRFLISLDPGMSLHLDKRKF